MASALETWQAKINQLTAENRKRRSAELESQLVEIRHCAANTILAEAKERPIARVGSDVFAGCTGVPEIQGHQLNAETLAAGVLNHGALLVRELFQPQQVRYLLEQVDRNPVPQNVGALPLGCSPGNLFDLLEVYQQCGLLDAVTDYLDGEALLFAERAKLRHHRADRDRYAAIPWHQDVNFFGVKCYAINCWAAVTPCGDTNPGLSVIPRRLEQPLGWQGEQRAPLDYGKRLPEGMLEALTRDHPIVTPVFQPGDAILFDEMTMHTTAPRKWQAAEQIVAISWFFRASRFPAWGTPLWVKT